MSLFQRQSKAGLEVDVEKDLHAQSSDESALGLSSGEDEPVSSPASADEKYDFQPPDGGLTAWLQVISAFFTNCLVWGYPAAFGVYQLNYVEILGLPASQVSWIGSVQIFITFIVCVFSGRLSDAGYPREILTAGTLLAVFGTYMASVSKTYWQIFLAQGVCEGIGLGLAFMPAISVVNSYFKKYRVLALTGSAAGTSFGSVVFPLTVQYLTPKIGFPSAVRCAASVALAMALTAIFLLKPRLPPRRSGPLFELPAFKEVPYVLFTVGSFLYFFSIYFGFFYINSFASDVIGFSTVDSVVLLLISNSMGFPLRPLIGYIADKYTGPVNIFIIATTGIGIMLYAWAGIHTKGTMYVFSVLYGISVGASQGCWVPALSSLNTDPQKVGTRVGMVEGIIAFATLAGPPTAGAIIDNCDGDYFWAQICFGSIMTGAIITFIASRLSVTGWRLWVMI